MPRQSPPEALKANRSGQHSIRINDQWRLCFVSAGGTCRDRRSTTDSPPASQPHPGEILAEEFVKPMGLTERPGRSRRAAAPHQRDRPGQARHHRRQRPAARPLPRHVRRLFACKLRCPARKIAKELEGSGHRGTGDGSLPARWSGIASLAAPGWRLGTATSP